MADVPVRPGLTIPDASLRWRFSRSGGPGGQSVNTSDTAVELRVDLAQLPEPYRDRALERLRHRLVDDSILALFASEHRSQLRNRQAAEQRLGDLLREATAAPPRTRRATRPSRGSVERRLAQKRRRSSVKRNRGRDAPDD